MLGEVVLNISRCPENGFCILASHGLRHFQQISLQLTAQRLFIGFHTGLHIQFPENVLLNGFLACRILHHHGIPFAEMTNDFI